MRKRLSDFFNTPCFDAQGNDLIAEIPQEAVQEAFMMMEVEGEIAKQKSGGSTDEQGSEDDE